MGGQTMSLGQDVSLVYPDKVRQTMKTPMGEQVVVLNGSKGYMSAGGQTQTLPSAVIEDEQLKLGRDLLVLLNNAGSPTLEAVAAGADEVNGSPCDVIAVTFRGAESRLCVAGDGMVVKQSYQGKHPMQGTPGLMEVLFSDYGEVDGRLIPHKRVIHFEGQELATITLDAIELNPDIDVAQFEMPEN
jgi:hypothetical protein